MAKVERRGDIEVTTYYWWDREWWRAFWPDIVDWIKRWLRRSRG